MWNMLAFRHFIEFGAARAGARRSLPTLLRLGTMLSTMVAVSFPTAPARACDSSDSWAQVHSSITSPTGIIRLTVYCYNCEPAGQVGFAVVSGDELIPATIVGKYRSPGVEGGMWSYSIRPEVPLTEGEMYGIQYTGYEDGPAESYGFIVEDIETQGPLALRQSYVEHVVAGEETTHDCGDGQLDPCGLPRVFRTIRDVSEMSHVEVFVSGESAVRDQHEFRYTFYGADGWEAEQVHSSPSMVQLIPPADEYCYSIHAREFGSDEEFLVGEECIPDAEADYSLTAPDRIPTPDEYTAEVTRTIRNCTQAPTGFEEPWCDAFLSERASGSCPEDSSDGCSAALEFCALPDASDKDKNERDDDDDDDDDDDASVEETNQGCSIARVGSVGNWWFAGAMILTLAGAFRRRDLRNRRTPLPRR